MDFRRIAPALLLAATPLARADDAVLDFSGGVLGADVTYLTGGDLGQPYLLLVSFTAGPTPLALLDPTQTGFLSVGLDLLSLAAVAVVPAPKLYPLPASPVLQGLVLRSQFVTLFGATSFVDEVSNPCAFALAQPLASLGVADNHFARQGHTASPLPGGGALVAGGSQPTGTGSSVTQSNVELWSRCGQSFQLLPGVLGTPRTVHTATVLADGRVLLLGGTDQTDTVVASGVIFDPATNTAAAIAPMGSPRTQHTATLLPDGRVLVTGGATSFDLSDPVASLASALASSELYNPASNSWSAGPNLPNPTIGHTATLLGNGRVLIVGGVRVPTLFGVPLPSVSNDARLYNPATNTLQTLPNIPGPRVYHGAARLADGNGLVYGGGDGSFITLNFTALASSYRFNTASNTWTAVGNLGVPRAYPNTVELGTRVYTAGGLSSVDITSGTGNPAVAIEVFDSATNLWAPAGTQLDARQVGRTVAVDGGVRLLTVGGAEMMGSSLLDPAAEVFHP
jgi:hypothetical protein